MDLNWLESMEVVPVVFLQNISSYDYILCAYCVLLYFRLHLTILVIVCVLVEDV